VSKPKIKVPYLSLEVIQQRAEEFRSKFSKDLTAIPVNPELMAELAGLTIIPIENLINDTGIDAVYIHTKNEILVDATEFIEAHHWPRLRFSIAHELGHYWLHRDLHKQISFSNEAEWIKYLVALDNNDRLEFQANEFAGRLTIPRGPLIKLIEQEKIPASEFAIDPKELESVLALRLSRRFFISSEVIALRFQREDLLQFIYEK